VFESILIANRGEIACRIMRTCRKLGVRSVAVFSAADRDAAFVQLADDAYPIGAAEPAQSYLAMERILQAASAARVDAIHPGYGFLAENAEFAELCAARGIVFIGPPPAAMRAMGLKHAAKSLMERAGVRVLPGYLDDDQRPERLAGAAEQVGYPVLIKAVAGGGGKGMRRVDTASEFARQLASAQSEAEAAFGDARVLIEKYLARPRHIEVQIFGDRQGNVVHLFERDCSMQRRHQKIIEEAPAPNCSEEFRRTIHELAVRAGRAIAYEGAGTVELIADVADGLSEERVYFMEMNTRLQVEHPVTELITGLDLVEWQLRVADGEPLPLAQSEITRRGHAIEARLYAEDPEREYMPQSGKLVHFALPEGEHVRIDAGFAQGDSVSVYYDALLAKLVVWGSDREAAVQRMTALLAKVEVAGPVTNLPLLSAVTRHPSFALGDLHTGFVEAHRHALFARDPSEEEELWVLACIGRLEARRQRVQHDPSPWADTSAFRINQPHGDVLSFARGEGGSEKLSIAITFASDHVLVELPQRSIAVRHARLDGRLLTCEFAGSLRRASYVEEGARAFVLAKGRMLDARSWPSPLELTDEADNTNTLKAPMPGKVRALLVGEGERVARGQALLSLEAMKMEHTLRAPHAGTVTALQARVGEQVEEGRTLLVLSASEEP
jgi:3-methylcrotonyl-CoA carboxylase alpha subunit